jgi:hypothetical protein
MADRSDRERGQPNLSLRRHSLNNRMGPCSRTPSGPAVSTDCINRPDRRLHPTNATASIYLLQRGSHPQRTHVGHGPMYPKSVPGRDIEWGRSRYSIISSATGIHGTSSTARDDFGERRPANPRSGPGIGQPRCPLRGPLATPANLHGIARMLGHNCGDSRTDCGSVAL